MDKLKKVTNKICELLKGTELNPMVLKNGCKIETFHNGRGVIVYDYGVSLCALSYHNMKTSSIKTFEIQKIIGSPIRESEVLMALGDTYAIDGDGIFMKLGEYDTKSDGFVYTNLSEPWQLGKHISSQSHEVIEFLYNVLNCSHE